MVSATAVSALYVEPGLRGMEAAAWPITGLVSSERLSSLEHQDLISPSLEYPKGKVAKLAKCRCKTALM